MRSLALAVILSLALAPAAFAKSESCRDAKGHYAKCPEAAPAAPKAKPAPAAKPAPTASASSAKSGQCRDAQGHFAKCGSVATADNSRTSYSPAPSGGGSGYSTRTSSVASGGSGGHPVCSKGKPCGNSCIAQDKVCHK